MEHGVLIKDFVNGKTIQMSLEEWEKCKIHVNPEPEQKRVRITEHDLYLLRKKIVSAIKEQIMDLSIIDGEPCNDCLTRCWYSVRNVGSTHPSCLTDRRMGIVDIYAEYCDKCYMPSWEGEARASKFVEYVNMHFADLEDIV